MTVNVVGAGLAGCEAAFALANRGIDVVLYEMRPNKMTPAHKTDMFGELVCSNSLKAMRHGSAAGLLKEEMRRLGSVCLNAADKASVAAGGALAVDRKLFSEEITKVISSHPKITLKREEVTKVPEGPTVIATKAYQKALKNCSERTNFTSLMRRRPLYRQTVLITVRFSKPQGITGATMIISTALLPKKSITRFTTRLSLPKRWNSKPLKRRFSGCMRDVCRLRLWRKGEEIL